MTKKTQELWFVVWVTGEKKLKKNEAQRFKDKRTKPKSWPLC